MLSDGGVQAAPKDSIKFVRGVTEGSGTAEAHVVNPDEMNIDMDDDNDDDDEDNEPEVDGNCKSKMKYFLIVSVPNVFIISANSKNRPKHLHHK